MTNQDKANIYDQLLRESDILQRENSKLKAQFVGNIPPNIQEIINRNNDKITVVVKKLENLFN